MSYEVLDERVAWAADITRLPADPNLVYGGTVVMRRSVVVPVFINAMPQQVAPILKKHEDEQTSLLKKILSSVGGQAGDMKGLEGEVRRQAAATRVPVDAFAGLGRAGIRVV